MEMFPLNNDIYNYNYYKIISNKISYLYICKTYKWLILIKAI